MSNLGPNLGLEEEILSGCSLHYTGTKKKKTAKGLSWLCFHTSQHEAGWAHVGRGGGKGTDETMGMSWSCVASVHAFKGLHSCP